MLTNSTIISNENLSKNINYENLANDWRLQIFADEDARWQIFAPLLDNRPGFDEWLDAWRQYRLKLQALMTFNGAQPNWPLIDQAIERERLALREAWRQWQNTADSFVETEDN